MFCFNTTEYNVNYCYYEYSNASILIEISRRYEARTISLPVN